MKLLLFIILAHVVVLEAANRQGVRLHDNVSTLANNTAMQKESSWSWLHESHLNKSKTQACSLIYYGGW